MSKHTPGPWRRAKYKVFSAGESLVANTRSTGLASDADEANARLIAAAPDLLEVLSIAIELLRKVEPFPGQADILSGCIEAGSAVIAKATGEAA